MLAMSTHNVVESASVRSGAIARAQALVQKTTGSARPFPVRQASITLRQRVLLQSPHLVLACASDHPKNANAPRHLCLKQRSFDWAMYFRSLTHRIVARTMAEDEFLGKPGTLAATSLFRKTEASSRDHIQFLEVPMFGRHTFSMFAAILCLVSPCRLVAEHKLLAEVEFVAHNGAEKTAGVWVDGQYVGYVKELKGDKKILLLPGKHEIIVRQAWYKDYVEKAVLEPGEIHTVTLSLAKDSRTPSKDATGELKIAATPDRAAVFVDGQFAGHADEFDGHGRAMLVTPGEHHVRIALPGFLPFETTVELRPHQKLKIETQLVKGSVVEAGALVSKN